MTTEPNYSLDVFVNEPQKLVMAVRRLHPYTDINGKKHPGTQAGIGVWFSKMRYARSGKASATISAQTATSHALFFTNPSDWQEILDYKNGIDKDDINFSRKAVANLYQKNGYKFVGNEDHKIGEMLGVKRPGRKALVNKAGDYLAHQLKQKIETMTRYSEVKLDETQKKALIKRCHRNVSDPLNTISDLFDAVCDEVIFNRLYEGV